WSTRDFPAALAWAKELSDPAEKKAAFTAMSNMAGELPPARRRALVAEVGEHTSNGFQILWGLDQKEALKGFSMLPPDEQSAAWGSLSSAIIYASPQEASRLPIPDEITAGEVVPGIAGAWAKTDAAKAATWVRSLKEEGDSQKLAAQNLMAVWSRNEPEAAAAWTKSLPDGPAKDAALDQLAVTAFKTGNRAEALQWSLSLTDPQRRQDSLHERYREWAEIDPAGAKAAVEALPFDAAGKEGVINNVKEAVLEQEEDGSGQ
ncbi:MAG TPA: hypothetical protein VHM91_02440, partial [Verrucomicrobiales bacterium]|nr:hypothetical protein [Verrucomicrobiales bacterium]